MPECKPLIFLCHASEDKPRVAELHHKLKAAGYQPWLDQEDLLPGQDWWAEIEKIIRNIDNVGGLSLFKIHYQTGRSAERDKEGSGCIG